MAQTYRSRFLGVLTANERRMTELFTGLATGIIGEVTKRADADGLIPRSAVPDMLDAVNSRVTTFFVGRGSNGTRAPFETLPDGSVWPLSPYMRALWQAITDATRLPVAQAAQEMTKRLPPDILAVMRQANDDPFAAAKAQVREQVFRPNLLARYEAPHTWVDPNGYTLSERIWNTSGDTRRRLDLYLERQIAEGRGSRDIARQLEQFLVPGRELLRTKAPYGTDASFDAMRLARTEITRAHGEATKVSAAMNPFVQQIKWNLSASHPKPDICDDNANGGENGDGVYPIDAVPQYPAHPHDLCYLTQVVIPAADRDAILDELRADVRRERAELVRLVGPVEVERFTQRLLGQEIQTVRAVPVTPQPAVSLVPGTIFTPPVVPEPMRIEAPRFTDKKQAATWLMDNGYAKTVDFGKIELSAIQDIADSAVYHMERFPAVKGHLDFLGSAQARNILTREALKVSIESDARTRISMMFPHLQGDALEHQVQVFVKSRLNRLAPKVPGNAWALAGPKELMVNEKFSKNIADMVKGLAYAEEQGFHPPGCGTVKSVVDHEFGHILDTVYGVARGAGPTAGDKLVEMYRLAEAQGGVKAAVSTYAATNNAEFWAETWAEYLNNPTPRGVAKAWGDWFIGFTGVK